MNDHQVPSLPAKGQATSMSDICARCLHILPERIFGQGKSRRQKRYLIGRPLPKKSGQSCPLCIFLKQVDNLSLEASGTQGREVTLATGRAQAAFSSFDTDRPWWHILGLETHRPTPDFMWYERVGESASTKLFNPKIIVSWLPTDARDRSVGLASIPRIRSPEEARSGILDLNVARKFLDICKTDHATACQFAKSRRKPVSIRLIDVHTRDITDGSTDSQYVALSYVWGNKVRSRHGKIPVTQSSSGLSGLSEVSETRHLPKCLPATLEDAMTITAKLGERYIWIDLFCIDQSNDHEFHSQMMQMNTIYQSATFTIVARDGEDAYAGISGVSRPMKLRTQPTCELPGGELMATVLRPAIANAGKSPWDTRAWTMQEFLFSYRVLSFTDHNLRLICRKEYFVDSIVAETGPDRHPVQVISRDDWDDIFTLDLRITEWDFKTFNSLISLYTARLLTYPDDILDACQGSLTELSMRTDTVFKHGMPVGDIHRSLLWSPHRHHTLTRRPNFPSWSWCGWFGRIEYRQWILDLPSSKDWQDNGDLTIINKRSKKRKGARSNSLTNPGAQAIAVITFPKHGLLRVRTQSATCTLQRRRDDRKSSTLLTVPDDEVGTLVKHDLGFHWTILNATGRPMIDLANNTEERGVFDETNHFLRLSQEESHAVEAVDGKVELLLIHHLPLVRDSLEHDWYLADMVSCLVIIRNPDGMTAWRLGALLLEKAVFESFQPEMVEVDIL